MKIVLIDLFFVFGFVCLSVFFGDNKICVSFKQTNMSLDTDDGGSSKQYLERQHDKLTHLETLIASKRNALQKKVHMMGGRVKQNAALKQLSPEIKKYADLLLADLIQQIDAFQRLHAYMDTVSSQVQDSATNAHQVQKRIQHEIKSIQAKIDLLLQSQI